MKIFNIFNVIWGRVHFTACSPPWSSTTTCRRSVKTWKMLNPQQKCVLSCSRQEYNNWRKRHRHTISCCRNLKIRYCSTLKTNLSNNDLLTSVWTPTPPPNIIVIIIIMKFLASGILKLVSVYCVYCLCFSIVMFSPTSCPLSL